MELLHSRYRLESEWSVKEDGDLAFARDLKLNRSVLLWRIHVHGQEQKEANLRRIRQAARFSDRRFVHILDIEDREDYLYVVQTRDGGSFLHEKLAEMPLNGRDILMHLQSLFPAIREARKERLSNFAVTADNLWLNEEGHLQVMNSWNEVSMDRHDVRGAALLLFQLCSRKAELPATIPHYNDALREGLGDLPDHRPEEVLEWASTAFLPSCTMKSYEEGMNRFLQAHPPEREPSPPPSVSPKRRKRIEAEEKPRAARSGRSFSLRNWIIGSGIVIGIGVLAAILMQREARGLLNEGQEGTSNPQPTATARHALANSSIMQSSPDSAGTTDGSSLSAQTSSSGTAQTTKPSAPPTGTESTVVPELINHTLDDASKLALQAGLKYQYLLEPNEMEKGKVFKQDPTPGTSAKAGDRITFWVSKGKS